MDNVFVARCDLDNGLFAARDFAPREQIVRFKGRIITLAEALAKGDHQGNPLQIGQEIYLDIEAPAVFANHSCDPNAGIINDRQLVALRPITRGQEIRYDYSTTMWEGMWTMRCKCGASACRGTIRDFPELPEDVQEYYLREGIVQKFIRSRLQTA